METVPCARLVTVTLVSSLRPGRVCLVVPGGTVTTSLHIFHVFALQTLYNVNN
jgi:hypothetical protein